MHSCGFGATWQKSTQAVPLESEEKSTRPSRRHPGWRRWTSPQSGQKTSAQSRWVCSPRLQPAKWESDCEDFNLHRMALIFTEAEVKTRWNTRCIVWSLNKRKSIISFPLLKENSALFPEVWDSKTLQRTYKFFQIWANQSHTFSSYSPADRELVQ